MTSAPREPLHVITGIRCGDPVRICAGGSRAGSACPLDPGEVR